MRKKSVLSGIILTVVLMIVLLIVAEAISIIVEFVGAEAISPVASVIIDIAIMLVSVAVGVVGLMFHSKALKGVISKTNSYVERLAVGDVDWEVPEGQYKEYEGFVKDMRELLKATKVQADMARDMSKGDFTVEAHVRGENDELGIALKDLVDENNQVLSEVQEASMSFTEGAKEVSAASQALAQGSTEQASAVEEINASIKDIATKTTANADDAR